MNKTMSYLYENPMPEDLNAAADIKSGEYEMCYSIKEGDVVLDLGAHVGFFTDYASIKVGNAGLVVAFEPHPRNFVLARNHLWARDNVILIRAAAGSKPENGELWSVPNHTGGHSLIKYECHTEGPIPVRVIDLAQFLRSFGIQPDFIKVDAENYEDVIFSNLIPYLCESHKQVQIAFEAHSVHHYHRSRSILENFSFEIFEKEPRVGVCHAWRLL